MRPRDSERSHASGHVRRVVPERGCEIVERARPGRTREVGTDPAPCPADRVTLDAALGVEGTGPCERVLRRAEKRLGERGRREQQEPGEDDQAPHGARHLPPPPPDTSSWPRGEHITASRQGRTRLGLRRRGPDGYSNTIFRTPGV